MLTDWFWLHILSFCGVFVYLRRGSGDAGFSAFDKSPIALARAGCSGVIGFFVIGGAGLKTSFTGGCRDSPGKGAEPYLVHYYYIIDIHIIVKLISNIGNPKLYMYVVKSDNTYFVPP